MRPLELVLAGFRSHEQTTEISFENRSLFAIVGPTGAGKSSLLDGICFALYGKTPRQKQSPEKLICSRSDEARVQLTFRADERTYEVRRAIRRGSRQAPHDLFDGDSRDRLCSGKAAVGKRIEELLGLDFDGFCSSVLLAQGDFAAFLSATPGDRQRILKGIFRLEQVDALRDAAKARVHELEGDLRENEGARRAIPDDVGDQIAAAIDRRAMASARAARLEGALPKEAELVEAQRDARVRSERAATEVTRFESAVSRLPAEELFDDLAEQETSIASLLAEARGALEAAEARRKSALDALGAFEARHGSERALVEWRSQAEGVAGLAGDLDSLEGRIKTLDEELAEWRTAADEADSIHAAALEALERAEVRRAEIEVAHAAHALRADLEVGEPCPVCEQDVRRVPTGEVVASVTETKAEERRAKAAEREAATAQRSAATELAKAESMREGLDEQRERIQERLEEARATLHENLGEFDEPLVEIDRRLDELGAARTEAESARASCEGAQDEVRRHEQLEVGFASARREIAGRLIELATVVELEPPRVDDSVDALATEAQRTGAELESRLADARTVLEEAGDAERTTRARLAELRAELDLDPETSIENAMARASSEAEVATERITQLEAMAARAAELDEERAGLAARQANFKWLYKDLAPREFIAFLLEDRTRLLLELASERLRAMTDRYRLEMDGKAGLNVIDELDGEKRRDVDTLSGGETFLASLALALALAELVTRSGGRLGAFFLDEGFGSLDAEAFDLAMDGIERIVTGDRLIGLVSHVPALAARVEDRIQLAKGPDGMSEVRLGGSLG